MQQQLPIPWESLIWPQVAGWHIEHYSRAMHRVDKYRQGAHLVAFMILQYLRWERPTSQCVIEVVRTGLDELPDAPRQLCHPTGMSRTRPELGQRAFNHHGVIS